MTRPPISITFACYNQIEYTKQCIESLIRTGFNLEQAVVVDNGSTDGTQDFLAKLPLGGLICNRQNLGCGVAWNQGALTQQAEWTVVMNNDIVVSDGWLDRLVEAAESQGLALACPAMIEGDLDYEFDALAARASFEMRKVIRRDDRHAVCMAIHRSVWDKIGYFRATPSLWGYEDTLFFNELDKAGITSGIVGSSWVHHFGSITLSAIKRERGLKQSQGLSPRDTYRLLGKSWWTRKWTKYQVQQRRQQWREDELARYRMTIHGERRNAAFSWR